jgi:hypothetical protein
MAGGGTPQVVLGGVLDGRPDRALAQSPASLVPISQASASGGAVQIVATSVAQGAQKPRTKTPTHTTVRPHAPVAATPAPPGATTGQGTGHAKPEHAQREHAQPEHAQPVRAARTTRTATATKSEPGKVVTKEATRTATGTKDAGKSVGKIAAKGR